MSKRVYQGVEVTKDEQDVLFEMVGYFLLIHYEADNDQFVLANKTTGVRAWPIEKPVFDGLINKGLIVHNPKQRDDSWGWYWLAR